MKKLLLTKLILSVVLGLSAFALPHNVVAAEQQDECSKEILLAYFPSVFVNETLDRFKVPKDQWDAINKELVAKLSSTLKDKNATLAKERSYIQSLENAQVETLKILFQVAPEMKDELIKALDKQKLSIN